MKLIYGLSDAGGDEDDDQCGEVKIVALVKVQTTHIMCQVPTETRTKEGMNLRWAMMLFFVYVH